METKLRFIKTREVTSPSRGHEGDAGLDFFFPTDLTYDQLVEANKKAMDITILLGDENLSMINSYTNSVLVKLDENNHFIKSIKLSKDSRVIIPSGIKFLIEPRDSMLMGANKSGLATKQGFIYTAEIVDSPYTGEVHIAFTNISNTVQEVKANDKIGQFIHVPIYLTTPEEIDSNTFSEEESTWGERGSDWQGSTDNK